MSKKLSATEISELIQSSPWFNSLDSAGVEQLTRSVQQKCLKKKAFLYSTGEYSNELYCLVEGRIRITMTSSEGQVFAVTDLNPIEWFGEAVIVHEKHRLLDALILDEAQVLCFPKHAVLDICEKYPRVYKDFFELHVLRNRGLYEILGGMLFYPLRARLAGRLLELTKDHGEKTHQGVYLDVKLNQNDFARLSMGSRQSVNKIFREWHGSDVVVMHKQKYLIKDVKALRGELFGYTGDLFKN